MKKLLLFLFFPVFCYGQGDQTIINVPINATGTTFQAILHLPNDYGTTTTAYPLLIFLHGLGEGGPNPASIYTSSTAGGPAYFIAQGVFPASFVNPKDGKSYKYIVVSPQANPQGAEGSTTAQELDYVLTYLYAHYRVDQTRVYLTGLSDGGESVVEYIGGEMATTNTMFKRTHNVAAIIPMSENGSGALLQQEADSIVSEHLGAWGFGSTDEQGQNTLNIAWYANVIKAGSMITTSYSGGHCCWGQFYDPTFTQNGMSIYQWMLQFTNGASVASPAVQTTTPPPPGTIPGKIEAASYDASVGVMTQSTSDAGGGLNVGWIDVGDWMDYKVNVTAAGSYTVSFRVATPNTGASFQLRTATGAVVATIKVPNTGGWQDWTTVTATASLAAGSQTLQLYSTSAAGWNINWMNFVAGTQGAQSVTGLAVTSDSALVASNSAGTNVTDVVILYPNPAKSSFTVQVGNALSGTMIIQVFDATGRIRQVQALQKDQSVVQVEMAADALP